MHRENFVVPDLTAPLDVAPYLAFADSRSTVKGILFQDLTAHLTRANLQTPKRYINFRDYPLLEYISLLLETAQRVYPNEPLRKALCLLGRSAYPTFASSLIGRVLYGALGKNVESILKLAPKGYGLVQNHATVHLLESSKQHVLLHYQNIPTFVDSLHVGVIEGAVLSCDRTPLVRVHLSSLFEGHMLVEFT